MMPSTKVLEMCSSRKNPYPPHGRSLEIPGGGSLESQNFRSKVKAAKLEFLRGREGAKQKTFHGGSMDIFWNYTMSVNVTTDSPEIHLSIHKSIVSTFVCLFLRWRTKLYLLQMIILNQLKTESCLYIF